MTLHDNKFRRNTYLNDPESGEEMARLLEQDRILTACMGGLFPERAGDLSGIQDILDIACGPGGWAQEVAFQYPQACVTGCDISRVMVEYAQMQSRLQRLENVRFEVLDATARLPFEDASFDLVNARTIAGFMLTAAWPTLVEECRRILRPGGILRVTETDRWGQSNSSVFERLMDVSYEASLLTGHCFDPGGHTMGITPMLKRLLLRAGFQDVKNAPHVINFSVGEEPHSAMYENFCVFFKLVQPFVLRTRSAFPDAGLPDQKELDSLLEKIQVEMFEDDFVGLFYLLTVWGMKPGRSGDPEMTTNSPL
jgi:ubiquinone/menaquinone biosynthesis C-methylase UbiE